MFQSVVDHIPEMLTKARRIIGSYDREDLHGILDDPTDFHKARVTMQRNIGNVANIDLNDVFRMLWLNRSKYVSVIFCASTHQPSVDQLEKYT